MTFKPMAKGSILPARLEAEPVPLSQIQDRG
jgi:hypothetical protein